MTAPRYVLDANVFLHAHRQHYPFDVVPGFWTFLAAAGQRGDLCSIDRVAKELEGNDQLSLWAGSDFSANFVSTDHSDVTDAYRRVVGWVYANVQYREAAKTRFMFGADGWLIAFAAARGCALVTHEAPAPDSKKSVKIPDVCAAIGVPYLNTVAMLRALGARLG